jgi:hypothetical protein
VETLAIVVGVWVLLSLPIGLGVGRLLGALTEERRAPVRSPQGERSAKGARHGISSAR